ncbi:MAG: hypothetical protein JOY55_22035 [Mycobacterium sp.]|jgi:hypothetical protein|nr:hypothetical protein [Mycobacterium sp.]MBV8294447.1 hypothetical protein [Mycobacterium sp.]
MSTALAGWSLWLAMVPNHVPDYNNSQRIIGVAVYVAIIVIVIGIVIFIIRRRR